jgi:hypothetical protein
MSARYNLVIAGIACAVFASGCGGSDEAPRADDGPVRYYNTYFRQNQLVSLMSFGGGLVYGFYQDDFSQPQLPDFAYAGFFKATAGASLPSGSTRIGKDYRFKSGEMVPISLVDFSTTDQALAATIESGQGAESLHASRATIDDTATDATLLGGAYSVQARSTAASQKGTASVAANGNLQADLPGACHVTGTLVPRANGNLYDASVTFAPACTVARGALAGHAFQSYSSRNAYLLLTSESGLGVLLLLVPGAIPQEPAMSATP